ncbi:sensor histidine kinase [Pedococcus sp. P5_B7]
MSAAAPAAGLTGPSRVRQLWLLAAAVTCLALSLWATVATAHRAAPSAVARETVFALSWIVVGAVAIWLGRSRIAVRILTLALVLSANFAGSFGLLSQAPHTRLIDTVTVFLVPLQAPVAGHLLLTYPTGRLDDRIARQLVRAAYALGATESVLTVIGHTRPLCQGCAEPLLHLGLSRSVARPLAAVISALWLILLLVFLWQVVRQYRRAGERQRRLLRLPYAAILVAAVFYAVLVVVAGLQGRSPWGLSPTTLTAMQVVALLGVPLSFLVGLLRERLSYKRIGDFVVSSASSPDTDLERALGTAVRDPGLRIAFPVGDGYVDPRGGVVATPARGPTTEVTVVGAADAPLALITHDRSLADEPALLTAAGSATRLLLENARLQAEVRSQLLEVRESRSRIVEAADDARARLERDLHDGAQQRLLAIGLALTLLETQPGDREVLENAKDEVTGALAELRALAAGIHPAVLTDLGLMPALDALAGRIGALVTVGAPHGTPRRQPPAVEAAAYFSTAEAVTNAVKHASATRVAVTVEQRDAVLVVTVVDDGVGGADPRGQGLTGIRDRLASVDGTLTIDSPRGGGTTLTFGIPCATRHTTTPGSGEAR